MYPVRKLVAGGVLAAAAVAGGVIGAGLTGTASAAPSTPSSSSAPAPAQQPPARRRPPAEVPLTGADRTQAVAAAKAAVPGASVDRAVEADRRDAARYGSTYEVHMTKSDGSHVTVQLDANFHVVATVAGGPPACGAGGPRPASYGETPLRGPARAKVADAAKAAVPGASIDSVVNADSADVAKYGSRYEVHMTKADNSQVTVQIDARFQVITTLDGHV